jgi:hypothetical protein
VRLKFAGSSSGSEAFFAELSAVAAAYKKLDGSSFFREKNQNWI